MRSTPHHIIGHLPVALAVAAAIAPAASAQDFRTPDARDAAQPHLDRAADRPTATQPFPGLARAAIRASRHLTPPQPAQDLRTPDTRDASEHGPDTAPVVEFVQRTRNAGGFDWTDAGLGAAAAIGLVLIGAGGAFTAARLRRRSAAA